MTATPRRIGVVTGNRADYAICLPVLRLIQSDPELELHLIVTGMHLSPEFGSTVNAIVADGFPIGDRVEMLLSSDAPEGIAKSMGLGTLGFAQALARTPLDILVVLADRFEMHAAAVAALPFRIVVAHIEGGDLTEGAIDDALRHSLTKLSHLHFVSTEDAARRVRQLGEEAWRVRVCGAPSLDTLLRTELTSPEILAKKYDLLLTPAPLLVTFHPVTLEFQDTRRQIGELLSALATIERPIVFTMPNADTSGRLIASEIAAFVGTHPRARLVDNFGIQHYVSMMAVAGAMVGNSSSGLIEAPSFRLPVVNIGTRQRGRVRGANVIDAGYDRDDITRAIHTALSPDFRTRLDGAANPYGTGHAAPAIVERLKTVDLTDRRLLAKTFVDISG